MIKSNLMSSRGKTQKMPPPLKGIKYKGNKGGKKTIGIKFPTGINFLYMLFILLMLSILYLGVFGIPGFLRGVIPQQVVSFLGLSEETAATITLREAGAPRLTAYGTRANDPAMPVNGSVEEIVKTMRPDVYLKNKTSNNYREKALSERIPYQKQAFHFMLSTFYKATPDGIGYLDLAYQAPNFYFVRAIAQDARTRNYYLEQLRSKVLTVSVSDSATLRDGNIEFSLHGGFQQPKFSELKATKLTTSEKIASETLALRDLANANQVRLAGMEKPIDEEFGNYRRVTLKTTTEADYPSLLNFADALQKSDIAFGVQQFVTRPAGEERMQSALEFVLYADNN